MTRRGRPPYPDILTPRESEVLDLLREGLTNEQVAERLGISTDGAKYHVSEILSKLGVTSREEAAAWRPEAAHPWWAAGLSVLAWPLRRLAPFGVAKLAGATTLVVAAGGTGVLVWAVVVTQGPGAQETAGHYPYFSMLGQIAGALTDRDAQFFVDQTLFDEVPCSRGGTPARPPACDQLGPDAVLPAVLVGVPQSEAYYLDRDTYERFVREWLSNIAEGKSDALGGPEAKLYAYGAPRVETSFDGIGTLWAVATRIAGPAPDEPLVPGPPLERQVLIFKLGVPKSPGDWKIIGVALAPDFLSPDKPELKGWKDDWFQSWQLWQEAAQGTMRPEVAAHRLTYVAADGALWVVSADGTGRNRLADVCFSGGSSGLRDLLWSPAGDKLAASCFATSYTDDSLIVLDGGGTLLAEVKGETASPRWSPDGTRLAYERWTYAGGGYPTLGAPLLQELGVLDLATLKTTTLAEHVHLLAWPLPDRILVGLNAEYGDGALVYDASWLDPDTGRTEPVPRLDDDVSVWLAPDAAKAVVTPPRLAYAGNSGIPLSVYDLGTGQETPIPGGTAGATSGGSNPWLQPEWLAVSADGSTLYWLRGAEPADASPGRIDVYRSGMDGSGPVELEPLPPPGDLFGDDLCRFGLALSADGVAAIYRGDCPSAGKIIVQDLETGARVEVGEGFAALAWRPTP